MRKLIPKILGFAAKNLVRATGVATSRARSNGLEIPKAIDFRLEYLRTRELLVLAQEKIDRLEAKP